MARDSIIIEKRKGNRGHPCLVLLLMGKKGETEKPSLITTLGELYKNDTHLQKFGPNPIFFKNPMHVLPFSSPLSQRLFLRQLKLIPLWTGKYEVSERCVKILQKMYARRFTRLATR